MGTNWVSEISKRIDISEGTIYPLLHRLKDVGHVTTYLQESAGGPPRKYYRLTESGRKEEHEQKEEWMRFAASVNALLEGKNVLQNEQEYIRIPEKPARGNATQGRARRYHLGLLRAFLPSGRRTAGRTRSSGAPWDRPKMLPGRSG